MSVKPLIPLKFIITVLLLIFTGGIFGVVLLVKKFRKPKAVMPVITVCGNCGYSTDSDNIICPRCGKKL